MKWEQPSFIFRRLVDLAGGELQPQDALGFAQADAFEAGAYLARWDAKEEAERLGYVTPSLRPVDAGILHLEK